MNREEAVQQAQKLAQEHPDRDTHTWIPRQESTGEWSAVRVSLPGGARPRGATVEAKPKPPQADDPRPPMFRDVGGPYGAA